MLNEPPDSFVVMGKRIGTSLSCQLVVVTCITTFGELNAFMDGRNCDQGVPDCRFRMANLKKQALPEVCVLPAKYFSYALEAKEVVTASLFVVSWNVNTQLDNSSRDVAITSAASARTSPAGGLLFAAFDTPNPRRG